VVPGKHDERDAGLVEPVECFEYGYVSPGSGFDDIEEVACMDKDIGFLVDDLIYRFLENCHRPAFPGGSCRSLGSRRLNAAKPKWVSAMWMSFI